jgi:hypothetical protein
VKPASKDASTLFLFLAATLTPSAASPQGMPLGSEFRVNTHAQYVQSYASVAADSAGNFAVIWTSYT